MTGRPDHVETFSGFLYKSVDWPLATAKDRAAATKKVRRKARAVDRVTQG
jgi:hypothetical protein